MANRAVELAVEISSRAVTTGFEATSNAAREMRDDVQSAATAAAGGMDRVAGAADNMDDKAGKATGALGALSSGFALVGLEQYAGALEGAAMATDFFSGVGQAMTLLLELETVQRAKAAVATGAHTAAVVAQSAAAKAAAVAQGALNAVMALNPVMLVVLAVVALVAVFVLAYKKSETFRDIVQAVGRVGRDAIGWVVDKVSELVGWVTGKASAAWGVLRDAVAVALAAVRDKFAPVLATAKDIFERMRTTIGDAVDAVKGKFEWLKNQAVDFFGLMMSPINTVKDAINWIVDKLANLKFPSLPNLPGMGRTVVDGRGAGTAAGGSTVINLNVTATPLTDPNAIAAALLAALNDYLTRIGRTVVIV